MTFAQGGNNSQAQPKECDHCVRRNERAKNIHSTAECNRFNADGTKKSNARSFGKANDSGGGRPRYNNTLQIELKGNKKKLKKQTHLKYISCSCYIIGYNQL